MALASPATALTEVGAEGTVRAVGAVVVLSGAINWLNALVVSEAHPIDVKERLLIFCHTISPPMALEKESI